MVTAGARARAMKKICSICEIDERSGHVQLAARRRTWTACLSDALDARFARLGSCPGAAAGGSGGGGYDGKLDPIVKGLATWFVGGNVSLIVYLLKIPIFGVPEWVIVFAHKAFVCFDEHHRSISRSSVIRFKNAVGIG